MVLVKTTEEAAMLKEFREFAMRGNPLDMAVGIIMGAAFGRIVSSLVSDIIMPPIGLMLGGLDFSNLFLTLRGGPYPSVSCKGGGGSHGQLWDLHKHRH